MRILSICLLLCWLGTPLAAQYSGDARSLAMGGSSAGLQGLRAVLANPAGMAFDSETGVLLFAENRFGLADLKGVAAAASISSGYGQFGLQVHYFGFQGFNRQSASLAYARRLMDRLSIGGKFDLIQTRIPEYGSESTIGFQLGFHARLLKKLHWAGHIIHPVQSDREGAQALTNIIRTAVTWEASPQIMLTAEAEKNIDWPMRVRVGMEYAFLRQAFFRLGFSSEPSVFSFGLGYRKNRQLGVDLGMSYHSILGPSPAFSLLYSFSKQDSKS